MTRDVGWAAFLRARGHLVILALVAAAALALRLYGLHWDDGALFHPDERAVIDRVDRLRFPFSDQVSLFQPASTWNPAWFPYGSFPLYVLKTAAWLWPPVFQDPSAGELAHIGRALVALSDVVTVLLVYALGAKLFGRWAGLLAAAFIAFAVLHIQQSHFYVSDIILGTLLTASMLSLAWTQPGPGRPPPLPSLRPWGLAGVFFGLALATKISAAPFALAFLAAAALQVARADGSHWRQPVLVAVGQLMFAAGVALLVFCIAQPYAVIDWRTYIDDVGFESKMVRRLVDLPYTRQYIGTSAYVYHAWQLAMFGVGLPLGVLMWGGAAFAAVRAVLARHGPSILLCSWVVPYFLLTGAFQVKFMRYMLAITPFLAVLAAGMAAWAWQRLADQGARRGLRVAFAGTLAAIVALTALYAIAYSRVYARPHPANAAAEWVKATVPPGTVLLQDSGWEEGFRGLEMYDQFRTEVYEEDTSEKRRVLIDALVRTEYILFYSNRQYGTIPRLPDRYSVTTDYYRDLFAGRLGFRLAHQETSYPGLFGVTLADDTYGRPGLPEPELPSGAGPRGLVLDLGYADESFTVYDHPKVLIFQKTLQGSADEQRAFFESELEQPRPPPTDSHLVMTPERAAAQQAGGTWSRLFDRGSIVNRLPFLFWYSLAQLAFLAVLPLTMLTFNRLPDRGYLIGKVLAFLLMAYVPWLLASVGVMPFGSLSIAAGLVLLAVVSAGFAIVGWGEMREWLTARRRLILGAEALFFAAFLSFYLVRTWNPDLWVADSWVASIEQFARGGEKPMDFAYFNAVVRSTWMPPYDPWFSGGYLNYYYFGMFMNAVPTKLLGIEPAKAVVVAVPFFFALTVGAAFSVGYNLAALSGGLAATRSVPPIERHWRREGADAAAHGPLLPRSGLSPVWAGGAAALFVAVLGNLDGLVQIVQGAARILSGEKFGHFDYWRSSRLMPDDLQGITEFPYWTFLFADPHAHLWVIPLTLLAAGLALAVALGGPARQGRRGTPVLAFSLLGLTLGAILATNSWDVITYALLGSLAVVIGEVAAGRSAGATVLWSAVKIGFLALLTILFILPYYRAYEVPVSQTAGGLLAGLPVIGQVSSLLTNTFNRSEFVTPVSRYVLVHGVMLFSILAFLIFELIHLHRRRSLAPLPYAGIASPVSLGDRWLLRAVQVLGWRWLLYALLAIALIVWAAASGYGTVALAVAVLLVLPPLAKPALAGGEENRARLFLLALLLLALLLGVLVDMFTFSGDIGRLNTVFKFYLQAWVLYSLVASFAVWHLWRGWKGGWVQGVWQGGVVALLVAGLLYPFLATPVRSQARFNPIPSTIDGMTYMETAVYWDRDKPIELRWDRRGIEWLQDNVEGSPVIVEGLTPLYRWGGRVSVYTGLPAIIGWDHHQKQQRGDYAGRFTGIDLRRREMDQLYSTTDAQLMWQILDRYGVSYIYVGDLERLYYPAEGLAKFDQAVGNGLSLAYENERVRIYQVDPR